MRAKYIGLTMRHGEDVGFHEAGLFILWMIMDSGNQFQILQLTRLKKDKVI